MTLRVRLVIEGDVQGVGYRSFVVRKALDIGVCGRVKNLSDGTVEVVCEADDQSKYIRFMKAIDVKNTEMNVRKITLENLEKDIEPVYSTFSIEF